MCNNDSSNSLLKSDSDVDTPKKSSNKKYYDSHRQKILDHQKKLRDEIMPLQFCECGIYQTTMCSNLYRHRRSARHLKAMQSKQSTAQESNLIQTH